MVVADTTIWIIFLALFNYAIVYKRNTLLGSIGYLALGLLALEVGNDTTNTAIGFFIMAAAVVNIVYDVLGKNRIK